MLNYLRLQIGMPVKNFVHTMDMMQLSEIREGKSKETLWLLSASSIEEEKLTGTSKNSNSALNRRDFSARR